MPTPCDLQAVWPILSAPSPSTYVRSVQFSSQNTFGILSVPPLPMLQNIFGNPSAPDFMAQVSQVALYFVYLAIAALVAAYFQVGQWGRGRGWT